MPADCAVVQKWPWKTFFDDPAHTAEKRCKGYGPEYSIQRRSSNLDYRCVRNKCLGDPATCCTTGTSGKKGLRCDARYTGLKAQCDVPMLKFCNKDRLFTNKRCIAWAKTSPKVADAQRAAVCNSPAGFSKNTARCGAWCLANPGRCDAGAAAYCGDGAAVAGTAPEGTPFCACARNPVTAEIGRRPDAAGYYMPECHDPACRERGYKNTAAALVMAGGRCPDRVDCAAIVNLSETARSNIIANVAQTSNCDRTFVQPAVSAAAPDGTRTAAGGGVLATEARDESTDANVEAESGERTGVVPGAAALGGVDTFGTVRTAMMVLVFVLVIAGVVLALSARWSRQGTREEIERGAEIAKIDEGAILPE